VQFFNQTVNFSIAARASTAAASAEDREKPTRRSQLIPNIRSKNAEEHSMSPMPGRKRFAKTARKRSKPKLKVKKKDPIFIDGERPRPMYVDYKDLELLGKMVNRQAKIIGRRKSGCTAASQHAVTRAIKRARFMALLPYVVD